MPTFLDFSFAKRLAAPLRVEHRAGAVFGNKQQVHAALQLAIWNLPLYGMFGEHFLHIRVAQVREQPMQRFLQSGFHALPIDAAPVFQQHCAFFLD